MKSIAQGLILAVSCAVIVAAGCAIYFTMRSPLFVVRVVEVTDGGSRPMPVDALTVTDLAAIPVGKISLFDVDLESVESRILTNPWIRSVRVRKSFPETLSIEVELKKPQAIFQMPQGQLSYVDSDGKPFGKVNLSELHDLPLLSGFERSPEKRIREALRLLNSWDEVQAAQSPDAPVGPQNPKSPKAPRLSSLSWDDERGYRGLMIYGFGRSGGAKSRTMVDFGQELDADPLPQLKRLSQVLRYLGENAIQARQIWADSGKKIVVKTAHGS